MKAVELFAFGILGIALQQTVHACIWDSDTLAQEKTRSPKMAEAILRKPPQLGDPIQLRQRIAKLEANRRENDPAWWNELAGAHIRLGEPKVAGELLEPIVGRFPDDYGVHANLGTAYHLLGRYAEAEKEIARDLEINPDAHFGLEKYHLALLQYLMRDAKYRSRHVYVDEFTEGFLNATHGLFPNRERYFKLLPQDYTNIIAEAEAEYEAAVKSGEKGYVLMQALGTLAALDEAPGYRGKWNLAQDAKLTEGIIYMASLNPKEPACFTMLGVLSWSRGDLHLAAAAFDKAIQLGPPQAELLKPKLTAIREHITKAQTHRRTERLPVVIAIAAIMGVIILFVAGKSLQMLRS